MALIALFDPSSSTRRWMLAGVVAFVRPEIAALAFVYLIAAWAILTGGSTIIAAIELRKAIDDEWLLGLSGAAPPAGAPAGGGAHATTHAVTADS